MTSGKNKNSSRYGKNSRAALRAVPHARYLLAAELRAMATATGDEYRQFASVTPWIRNIWHACADQLEESEEEDRQIKP